MSNNPLESFAIAQALYGAIAEQMKTGNPDNLRGQVDRFVRDGALSGTPSRDLVVNGQRVGKVTADMHEGLEVTDPLALDAWKRANGLIQTRATIVLDELDASQMAALVAWAEANAPDAVVYEDVCDPAWADRLAHTGQDVYDPATGERVPGVRWSRRPGAVKVTGCKWHGNRTFPAVADLVAQGGLGVGSVVAGLIGGGDE